MNNLRYCTGFAALAMTTAAFAQTTDDCASAPFWAHPGGGATVQFQGNTTGATIDCTDITAQAFVWAELELPHAFQNVTVDFCPTTVAITSTWRLYFPACPGASCFATAMAFTNSWPTCPDGTGAPLWQAENLAGPGSIFLPFWLQGIGPFVCDITITEAAEASGACCVNDVCTAPVFRSVCAGQGGQFMIDTPCTPHPCLACEAGDLDESVPQEPCVTGNLNDPYNGGCNETGSPLPWGLNLACDGPAICGSAWAVFNASRDTDWFGITVNGDKIFTINLETTTHMIAGPIPTDPIGGGGPTGAYDYLCGIHLGYIDPYAEAIPGVSATVTTPCWPAGDYMFWAGTVGETSSWDNDTPCEDNPVYRMWLTCEDCVYVPPFGACCFTVGGPPNWQCVDGFDEATCLGFENGTYYLSETCAPAGTVDCLISGACCRPTGVCEDSDLDTCLAYADGSTFIEAALCVDDPCVFCDVNDTDELEACGGDTNGGCNSDPAVFEAIVCEVPVCGTAWDDWATTGRDTDWYDVTVAADTIFTINFESTFYGVGGMLEYTAGLEGSGNCADISGYISPYVLTDNGQVGSVASDCMPAGTYFFFAGSVEGIFGNPPILCDVLPKYRLWVNCGPCGVQQGACCINAQCQVTDAATCSAAGGTYLGDGTDCVADPCYCPEDLALPRGVEQQDLNAVLNRWGDPNCLAGGCPEDLALPLGVEQQDLNAVLNRWGDPACVPN